MEALFQQLQSSDTLTVGISASGCLLTVSNTKELSHRTRGAPVASFPDLLDELLNANLAGDAAGLSQWVRDVHHFLTVLGSMGSSVVLKLSKATIEYEARYFAPRGSHSLFDWLVAKTGSAVLDSTDAISMDAHSSTTLRPPGRVTTTFTVPASATHLRDILATNPHNVSELGPFCGIIEVNKMLERRLCALKGGHILALRGGGLVARSQDRLQWVRKDGRQHLEHGNLRHKMLFCIPGSDHIFKFLIPEKASDVVATVIRVG